MKTDAQNAVARFHRLNAQHQDLHLDDITEAQWEERDDAAAKARQAGVDPAVIADFEAIAAKMRTRDTLRR